MTKISKLIMGLLLSLILLNFTFAYDFENEKVKNIIIKNNNINNNNNIDNTVKFMMNKFDNNTIYEENKELSKKIKNINNLNNNNDKNKLQIKEDKINNREVKYNNFGVVEGRNLKGMDLIISDKLIAVDRYNKLTNDYFTVTLYTGDNGYKYSVYKYDGFSDDYTHVRTNGKLYGEYISSNGYITFNTSSFSTFVTSFSSNYNINDNSELTLIINNYFNDFDSVIVQFEDNILLTSNSLEVGESVLIGSDIYSPSGKDYELQLSVDITNTFRLKAICEDDIMSLHNVKVIAFTEGEDDEAESNLFSLNCLGLSDTPIQNTNFVSTYTRYNGNILQLSLNDFYSNYDKIDVIFNSDLSSRTLSHTLGQSNKEYYGNNLTVLLGNNFLNNNILLNIQGNVGYSSTFNIRACNTISNQCTSYTSFSFNSIYDEISNAQQIATFNNIQLSGYQSVTYSMNDFFSNYDEIKYNVGGSTGTYNKYGIISGSDITAYDGYIRLITTTTGNNIIFNVYGNNLGSSNLLFNFSARKTGESWVNGNNFYLSTITSTLSENTELQNGLRSYFKFDEGSGNSSYDYIRENNYYGSGINFVSGKINNALYTDGNDHFNVQRENTINNVFNIGANYSVSFWVNPNNVGTAHLLCVQCSSSSVAVRNQGFSISLDSDNKISSIQGKQSTNSLRQVLSNNAIPTDTWSHVVVVAYNGETRFYINGELDVVRTSLTGNIVFGASCYSPHNVMIGGLIESQINGNCVSPPYDGVTGFNGDLDEFAIYNRSLTADEVSDLYNNGVGLAYPFGSVLEEEDEVIQIANFLDNYYINDDDTIELNLNNFYNNYDQINLMYNGDNISITNDVLGETISINSALLNVTLIEPSSSPPFIKLRMRAKNISSSDNTISLQACLESSCTPISSFNVVTSLILTNAPQQIATFTSNVINGNNTIIYTINNFFTDYSSLSVAIEDPISLSTQVINLDVSNTLGNVLYTSNQYQVRLNNIFGVHTLAIENYNYNNTIPITMSAINNIGTTIGNQFIITTIQNVTSNGGNGGNGGNGSYWSNLFELIDNLSSSHKLYIALGIMVLTTLAFVFGTNLNFNPIALTTILIIEFVILSVVGLIPSWVFLTSLFMVAIVIAYIVRNILTGNGNG